jgi:hypothetical protein
MGLQEDAVSMIQIDGPRRRVYIKLVNNQQMNKIIQDTNDTLTYKSDNGEQSNVTIETAGMGTHEIHIATLPPEITDRTITEALNKYGEVIDIKEEYWTKLYRNKVSNGIRLAKTKLKHHLPPRMIIAGHTADVSYTGQPQTCFACHETSHIFQQCPHHRRGTPKEGGAITPTWAHIAEQQTIQNLPATHKSTTGNVTTTQRERQQNGEQTGQLQIPVETMQHDKDQSTCPNPDTEMEMEGTDDIPYEKQVMTNYAGEGAGKRKTPNPHK